MSLLQVDEPAPESAGWDEVLPGPELAALLEACTPGVVDDFELIDVIRAARRLENWAQSLLLDGVAELARRRHEAEDAPGSDHHASPPGVAIVEEVSAALTVTRPGAAHLVGLAEAQIHRLPETRLALATGLIDLPRLAVLTDALEGVHPTLARKVEQQVGAQMHRMTAQQLRRRVRHLLLKLDPEAARKRTRRAIRQRRLQHRHNPSGTADLTGRDLPDGEVHIIYERLTTAARALQADGDPRDVDALRADLFVGLLRGVPLPEAVRDLLHPRDDTAPGTAPGAGTAHLPNPDHGGDGQGAGDCEQQQRPAECDQPPGRLSHRAAEHADVQAARTAGNAVAGLLRARLTAVTACMRSTGDTITAQALAEHAARTIAAISGLRPHPCGPRQPIDTAHGDPGYRPSARTTRHVQARDGTCRFPTCHRPATACDLDHTRPHHHHGVTCPCNLAALCRRHHTLKQTPGWRLHHPWPGVLLWITPSGHWYVTGPDDDP